MRNLPRAILAAGGACFGRKSRASRSHRVRTNRLLFESLESRCVLSAGPVVISEFLASNHQGLLDEDGDASDWIEIHNISAGEVSLNGWYLTDNASELTKWAFPDVTLADNEYMVVFASNKNRRDPASNLHTNFALSADGEYLAIVESDGETISYEYAPEYPGQYQDVSYGLSQPETVLLSEGSPLSYLVPTSQDASSQWTAANFNNSSWTSTLPGSGTAATTGIGYETGGKTFTVKCYRSNITVDSLTTAETVIANSSYQTSVTTASASTINYFENGSTGHFGNDVAFPGSSIGTDMDNFVLEVTGQIVISAAGNWTFGVNSDDGFSLTLTQGSTVFTSSYPDPRGAADTLSTFNITETGVYDVRLVFYEQGGAASVELFAAQGAYSSFDSNAFDLVGDTANGGIALTSYLNLIQTNVQSALNGVNTSIWVRIPFEIDNLTSLGDAMSLLMKYDDGFVAYLNGVEIASRNAPSTVAWNSAATALHETANALVYEQIDVSAYLGALVQGTNVLAIQGLNVSLSSTDLLILPKLVTTKTDVAVQRYFVTPTPGAANRSGVVDFVKEPTFSKEHGFCNESFTLTLATATPNATIRYTLNGSAPTETSGIIYTGSIQINTTAVVRAIAYKADYEASAVATQSYIFLDDVVNQSSSPSGFPSSWTSSSSSIAADYAMDQEIVSGNSDAVKSCLLSLPTLSLVMNTDEMFGTNGIYSQPTIDGLEIPASAELVYADGAEGFQINAGLEVTGGYSRTETFLKHSLRLSFKSKYGASKLSYAFFGEDAAEEYDTIALRANFNDSWLWTWNNAFYGGGEYAQFIRDEWNRAAQLAMGDISSHGTFVNVYINGLYWGVYNACERPDEHFGASYLGGDSEDYDVIHNNNVINGDLNAWDTMFRIANTGHAESGYSYNSSALADNNAYQLLQQYLDVSSLADYVVMNFYGGNWDWDWHNWYAFRKREDGAGYKFVSWDAEGTLLDVNTDITSMNNDNEPTRLFQQLCANAEFRILLADRLYKACFNDGALSASGAAALYSKIAAEIEPAILAESARWGDVTGTQYTTNNWANTLDWELDTYFPQRTSVFLQQFRNKGFYPSIDAPTLNQQGGQAAWGFKVAISAASGTIYYTLDGSDPRLTGGGVSSTALVYNSSTPITLTGATTLKTRALSSDGTWSALNEADFTVGTPASAANLVVTELNYAPYAPLSSSSYSTEDFEFIELRNTSSQIVDLAEAKFTNGITFNFSDGSVTTLNPGQYIVVARNVAAFQARYGTSILVTGAYSGKFANEGEKVALVDRFGNTIFEFTYGADGDWPGRASGKGASLEVINPTGNLNSATNWRSSTEYGGSPGTAGVGPIVDVVVNEVLPTNGSTLADSIELLNTSTQTIDVSGWYLSDSAKNFLKYRIPDGTVLQAGQYVVFNQMAFTLLDAAVGGDVWLMRADASGNLTQFADHADVGAVINGNSLGRWPNSSGALYPMVSTTLGSANSGPKFGPIIVSEVHYNPGTMTNAGDLEFVEIYNSTASAVSLTNWSLGGDISFAFASGTSLAAYSSLVVLPFDPSNSANASKLAAFRSYYNIGASVQLVGGYSGLLNDQGGTVQLYYPDTPPAEQPTLYPSVLEDEVIYGIASPWPSNAAGLGKSLNRLSSDLWGDNAASWSSQAPSPGTTPYPKAVGDMATTIQGLATTIAVLANDTDPEGTIAPATVAILAAPSHGQVSVDLVHGTILYTPTAGYQGTDQFTYRVKDTSGFVSNPASVTVTVGPSSVQGRYIFYNNSAWDGNKTAANTSDDSAIAADKTALLPGKTATFANYTSYSRGINGIMVDFDYLPGTPTASDFEFKVGNTTTPDSWAAAPTPQSITVRQVTVNGVVRYRLTITWADNAIQKQWLQVTVKATANTGLAQNDVFYFGNAIGETGDTKYAYVTSADEIGARKNPHTPLNQATITDGYDFNRDKLVTAADEILARKNGTTPLTALKLITAPAVLTTDDTATTNEDTAVAIAVLSNDRNASGGTLSVYRLDTTSRLGASLKINADNTVRYDSSTAATIQALAAGTTVWDTFTYTVKDSNGLLDTATVKIQVTGLNESAGNLKAATATKVSVASTKTTLTTASLKSSTATAAHDTVLRLTPQDNSLGYLNWLYDFEQLNKKLKQSNLLAVDAILKRGLL